MKHPTSTLVPVHSSVLGSTNTDDPEAAAITSERKKNPAHSLRLGETNTEDAVEEESSSENIKAVLVHKTEDVLRWRRSMETVFISKMDEMSSCTFHLVKVVVSKQIGKAKYEADLGFLFDGALLNTAFL